MKFLLALLFITGCSGSSQMTTATPTTGSESQLDQKSPVLLFVGAWSGTGTRSQIAAENLFANCEKVRVEIKAVSSKTISFVDRFTCSHGTLSFTNVNRSFDIVGSVVSLNGTPVGQIADGYLQMNYLTRDGEVQWQLSLVNSHMSYKYSLKGAGTSTLVDAELSK